MNRVKTSTDGRAAARSLVAPGLYSRLKRLGTALVLISSLIALEKTALAQTDCSGGCEQTMNQCLQMADGDAVGQARCHDAYDACVEACLAY